MAALSLYATAGSTVSIKLIVLETHCHCTGEGAEWWEGCNSREFSFSPDRDGTWYPCWSCRHCRKTLDWALPRGERLVFLMAKTRTTTKPRNLVQATEDYMSQVPDFAWFDMDLFSSISSTLSIEIMCVVASL